MAYDDTLPDDDNWVRFLVGDTTATQILADDEITAILAEEDATGSALKYFAAATAAEAIAARWTRDGGGISEKQVESLRIKREAGSIGEAMRALAAELRRKGAEKASPSPYLLGLL